jgi:hypothetical protein
MNMHGLTRFAAFSGRPRPAAAGHIKDDHDVSGAFFRAGRRILCNQLTKTSRAGVHGPRLPLASAYALQAIHFLESGLSQRRLRRRYRARRTSVSSVFPG